MSTSHTPTPWAHRHNITSSHGVWSLTGLVAEVNGMQAEWMANGERIVACVNACAGIADPAAALAQARVALVMAQQELANVYRSLVDDPSASPDAVRCVHEAHTAAHAARVAIGGGA